MGNAIIIAGESGRGKSSSIRTMNKDKTLWIKVVNKPSPFKPEGWNFIDPNTGIGNMFFSDNSQAIIRLLSKAKDNGFESIVIDDFGYTMTNEFMRRSSEKGFDKWNDLSMNVWSVFHKVQELDDDMLVYFIFHTEIDNMGNTTVKTLGKLLNEKVNLPGMATIVFIAERIDGEYLFRTQTTGADISKSPIGMFETELIPNDLGAIDKKIRKYYAN